MINISKVMDNYPKIASMFPAEWFESEIKKESNHLLIKQLVFDDRVSLQYLNDLEECLELLEGEINEHPKHFKTLRNANQFKNTLAELKIGFMFKKMGFSIEFESPVQNNKVSDIKINLKDIDVFIEVSTRIGPDEEVLEKHHGITISKFEIREPRKFSDKIVEESTQLSKDHSGIVALYFLSSFASEERNIMRAFGFDFIWDKDFKHIELGENINKSVVSALLLSSPYDQPLLCVNPLAKIPLPDIVLKKFEDNEIEIIIPTEITNAY
jgi:hypothetical protein